MLGFMRESTHKAIVEDLNVSLRNASKDTKVVTLKAKISTLKLVEKMLSTNPGAKSYAKAVKEDRVKLEKKLLELDKK